MSTAERDVRRLAVGKLVEGDEIEIDLTHGDGVGTIVPGGPGPVDPENEAGEPAELGPSEDADESSVRSEPVERVFSGNARFRPIVVALVLASAVVATYGAVAVLSLLRAEQPKSELLEVVAPRAAEVLPFTPAGGADAAPCSSIDVHAFADTNGNAVQGDLEEGQPGVTFAVRAAGGALIGEMTTDANGDARLALPQPGVVTVEAIELPPGMWSGPRAAVDAGAATILSGATCGANLGYVWVPVDGLAPALVAANAANESLANTEVQTALLPGIDGGVQLHGRAWVDADANGLFSASEKPSPGVEVRLVDSQGTVVSTARTGPAGRYTFVNLEPRHPYAVVFSDGGTVPSTVQALGGEPAVYDADGITFLTGDIGLPVWGVDAAFAPPTAD